MELSELVTDAEREEAGLEPLPAPESGLATEAPEARPEETEEQPAPKPEGLTEEDPEGLSKTVPEAEEKPTEQPAEEEKPLTKEEIADLRKQAESAKEHQASFTKQREETKRLQSEIDELKAAQTRPQTDEEYLSEALKDEGFKKSLEAKGYMAEHFFDENGNLSKNTAVFVRERESFISGQRAAEGAAQAEASLRADAINSTFDELTKAHGDAFTEIRGKVIDHIKDKYNASALMGLPVEDVKDIIAKAVRTVEPKLFEKADVAAEIARQESIRKTAVESTAVHQPRAEGANQTQAKLKSALDKFAKSQDPEDWAAYEKLKTDAAKGE